MSGELDILQTSPSIEFYPEMNFIPARRIIAMHAYGSVGKLSKIPRPSRMIENDVLIKLFDFRIHEKKRTAAAK